MYSFLLLNSMILLFYKTMTRNEYIWFVLSLSHGIAHIIHPAHHGIIPNINYTPLWDYIVHGAQALSVYYTNKKLLPIGIIFCIMVVTAGIISYWNKEFIGSTMFIFLSIGGVFGMHYNTMLLNKNNDKNFTYTSAIVWILSYVCYYSNEVEKVDAFINNLGLYRVWMLSFFYIKHIHDLQLNKWFLSKFLGSTVKQY